MIEMRSAGTACRRASIPRLTSVAAECSSEHCPAPNLIASCVGSLARLQAYQVLVPSRPAKSVPLSSSIIRNMFLTRLCGACMPYNLIHLDTDIVKHSAA